MKLLMLILFVLVGCEEIFSSEFVKKVLSDNDSDGELNDDVDYSGIRIL